jgi:hypothetical protein
LSQRLYLGQSHQPRKSIAHHGRENKSIDS